MALVSVFANATYNDITPDGEVNQVIQSLNGEGHGVTAFNGISAAAFAAATDNEQVLVIPELENGNLAGALGVLARNQLNAYLNQGGSLIIFGSQNNLNEVLLLSTVFGIAVAAGPDGTGGVDSRAAGAVGTQFENGPATLNELDSTSRLITSSLPATARSIYTEGIHTTVATFRVGFGQIIYLGYDWFDASNAAGGPNNGWNAVLDSAVSQATSLTYQSTTSQDLILRRFDVNGYEIIDQNGGAILARKRISETNQILITGADNLNTGLTVDYAFGGFIDRSTTYNAGSGATDRLSVTGGIFTNTFHTITSTFGGSLTHAGVPIIYTGAEVVDDVTDADSHTIKTAALADVAVVDDGPNVFGNTTVRFRSTNGTFSNTQVSRKTNIFFDTSDGADEITLNLTGSVDRLVRLSLDTGGTNGDEVNVLRAPDRRLDITSSGGTDTVNIGNAGITSAILGEINISNPSSFSAVRIDASAETAAAIVRVRENGIDGLTPRRVAYIENDISTLTLLSGSGVDDIRVESTAASKTTSISSGGGNDTFLIEAPLLGPGGTLNLDGQAGTDTLTMRGGGITNVVHTVSGPAAGQIQHDGRPTNYAGIETAQDVTVAANYTLTGTDLADVVNVVGGPTVLGAITTQFNATNGTFGLANVGNKSNITYNSAAGADAITVNNPGGSTGLAALTINSGATDGDVVSVLATRDGVNTTITNAGGSDAVNVGNAGLLTSILGALNVNGASNLTSLNVNASADATARTVTVTNSSVSGLAVVPVNYSGDAISSLTVQTGSGADVLTISGTAASRTTNVLSGDGNDTFTINATGLGSNSVNNLSGQGGDDTFTSSFSVDATINVDGGPHAVGDRIRYDFAGLGVVLLANSVAAAGRLPINITNIEFQDLIGLGTDIPSVTVRHSALGGISTITTTNNAHNAVIQVQGGATYSLFNLRPNVPISVEGSVLDDRLEIINTGSVLLDAEITFDGAQNSSFGDSLAFSGAGNVIINETHSATGPNIGAFNLDNVMTVGYTRIEALTDALLTFGLTYNTPGNQADQLNYGDGATIPESHRISSGNNGFLAYEFATKVEVTVNTGTGGADGADIVNISTTIDMPLMTVLNFTTGAGNDRLTINGASPLPQFNADLGAGALDRLIVLAGDTPNELGINGAAVTGVTTPISYSNTEELEVFGQGGDDVFNAVPAVNTRFILHGDAQDAADTLKIDAQANNVTVAEGSVTAIGRQPIDFDGIEAGELFSSTVQIVTLTLLHDASGGASTVHTGDTANSGTLQVQDGPVFAFRDLIPSAILFLQGGAGDDRLNFIHDGTVLLNAFVDFVGGGHATADTLAFSGNQPPLASETHQPSGPNTGVVRFGTTLVARYAGLENIEDSLPVTQLSWLAQDNVADNVFYENGVFQPSSHQIRSGNAGFVTHQFTDKTNVILRTDSGAGDLADTIDVNVTQVNTGLTGLEIFAGAGADVAAITLTAALPPTIYHGGTGSVDLLTVRGTAGDDALTVTATNVNGAGTSVTYDNEIESLRVEAGDGNDTIDVQAISATITTVIAGGAGNDTATVQAPLAAMLTFEDGAGSDRLILVGTGADETFNLGGTTVTGAGATVNYSATLERVDARGLGGLDEFFVAPSAVTEFFVDGGPPTAVLPGDRLEVDFAGTTGRRLTFTGPGAGAWTFTNRKQVGFTDIEEFNYFDLLAAGADAGSSSAPNVMLLDALSLEESVQLLAYEAGYKEGVRVALGDLNGDGIPELITAPGRSHAPQIRVFDVTSGAELTQYRFLAYDSGYVGGVYVAAGDVDGDGSVDIITSVGRGPSNVRVFRNQIKTNSSAPFGGAPFREFSPFGVDFIGGATVAAADFTGDGKAEIVVGSSTGMRATVRVYNVSTDATSYTPIRQFLPFDAEFRGGVFVSAGRINGDGTPDIIATQGPSGDSRVELFDGLLGASLANFDGYTDASSTAPIRGVGADLDGDGMIERIITGQGPDGRTNLLRRFTTNGALVDQIVADDSTFLNGFHLASFFANADVLRADVQAQPTAAEIVTKLYQQVLGRAPEPAGLDYWVERIDGGASYGTVASGIFESAERLDPIIKEMYRDYLLREAEPAGVTFYRELWRADGGPDNVVANIISSAEFFASAGGTNTLWVTELYRRLLGREPEAAGLDYWTSRLNSGQLSRQQVVFGFTRSNENFSNLITGWYQQYLGRTPTTDELNTRVDRMRGGVTQREIQIELIDSLEYATTP